MYHYQVLLYIPVVGLMLGRCTVCLQTFTIQLVISNYILLTLVCVLACLKNQTINVCVSLCVSFSAVETIKVVLGRQKSYWKSLAYCGNYGFFCFLMPAVLYLLSGSLPESDVHQTF